MKTLRTFATLFLGASLALSGAETATPSSKPDIVIFLADDLGYEDVGFTGGREIRTPHLDALAARGARLDQYYVQPVCTPTRAALLTGRYPMRHGLQSGVIRPWESRGLPLEERTLPQALKAAGYTTAIAGKWHLGMSERAHLPTQRGFDHQYGHYCGAIDYHQHTRDGGFDWHRDDRVCRDEGYSTHLLAKEAVRLIKAQPAGKPLFLYLPFNAVHAPHQVPAEYKAPYTQLKEPRRTYAGMVAAMDEAIGQVVAALEAAGRRTNTLFLFSSDNGGPSPGRVTDNGALRAGKGTVYEGGVRVCALAAWDGRIKPGSVVTQPIHAVDWFPTLAGVAGASKQQKLPLDGRDVLAALTMGADLGQREILMNTTPARGALRFGDWKLVLNGAATDGEGEESAPAADKRKARRAASPSIELFNLATDRGETNNLAKAEPARVEDLQRRYERFAKQAAPIRNYARPAGFKSPKVWGEPE